MGQVSETPEVRGDVGRRGILRHSLECNSFVGHLHVHAWMYVGDVSLHILFHQGS